jgi:hypothetical protein
VCSRTLALNKVRRVNERERLFAYHPDTGGTNKCLAVPVLRGNVGSGLCYCACHATPYAGRMSVRGATAKKQRQRGLNGLGRLRMRWALAHLRKQEPDFSNRQRGVKKAGSPLICNVRYPSKLPASLVPH